MICKIINIFLTISMGFNSMKQTITSTIFFITIVSMSAMIALPASSAPQSAVKQIGSKAIEAKIAQMTLVEKN
jgi:hypothetical protein